MIEDATWVENLPDRDFRMVVGKQGWETSFRLQIRRAYRTDKTGFMWGDWEDVPVFIEGEDETEQPNDYGG